MIRINGKLLSDLSQAAKSSERQRKNYNFHTDYSDPINRMLNAVEPGGYFPPHKHEFPDKREVFIILKGQVLVLEFDDKGSVTDHFTLDASTDNKAVEIQPGRWHSIIPLNEGSVLYEVKDGPYDKGTDKVFPEWAPKEGEPGAREFTQKVLKDLEIGGDDG